MTVALFLEFGVSVTVGQVKSFYIHAFLHAQERVPFAASCAFDVPGVCPAMCLARDFGKAENDSTPCEEVQPFARALSVS